MNDKQNSFKFRFISLLILLVFDFNPVFSYISLPLEYLPKKNYQFLKTDNLINKPELVMKDLFYKRLITHLNIGTPEKNQMMLIDTNDNDFYFTSLNQGTNFLSFTILEKIYFITSPSLVHIF